MPVLQLCRDLPVLAKAEDAADHRTYAANLRPHIRDDEVPTVVLAASGRTERLVTFIAA